MKWSFLDQAAVSATGFLTALLLARFGTPEELGLYYLAWGVVVFVTAMQCNLISLPYTREAPLRDDGVWTYSGSTLLHFIVLVGATLALLAIANGLGHAFGAPAKYSTLGWVLMAVLPALLLREFFRRFAYAHLWLPSATVLDGAVALLQCVALAAIAWQRPLSATLAFAVSGVACLVGSAGWWMVRRPPWKVRGSQAMSDWQGNWQLGRWGFASQLTGIAFYLLPWLLAATHGEAAAGRLAAASTLVGFVNPLALSLNNYYLPKMSHAYADRGRQGLAEALRHAVWITTVGLGVFFLVMLVAGGPLAAMLFGPAYAELGWLLAALAAGALAEGWGNAAGNALWALGRPNMMFLADLVYLAATVITALAWVGPHGALGVGLALLSGRTASAVLRWLLLAFAMRQAVVPAEISSNVVHA